MACDPSVADTIETLTERLKTSTLVTDRRDACRGLKALAKDYRVHVCTHAMEALLQEIRTDRHDSEIVNYCLDTINYIILGSLGDCSMAVWPDVDSQSMPFHAKDDQKPRRGQFDSNQDPGRELAEIFLKQLENVTTVLGTATDNDPKTRWVTVRLLCGLARQNLALLQESILQVRDGTSELMKLINDEHEYIRNDALLLFVRLTQGNINIQNLVTYESGFDKLIFIIDVERYLNGTVAVVMDCLSIILNLTQNNEVNQVLFREYGHIKKLIPFFDHLESIQWTNEKTSCLVLVLRILGCMLLPTNSAGHVQQSQQIMQQCGLLDRLCQLLTAHSMPIGVLSETINTASDIVRGHLSPNANMVMQTNAMMPVMLLSMVKEMCHDQERRISELYNYTQVLHNFVSDLSKKLQTL